MNESDGALNNQRESRFEHVSRYAWYVLAVLLVVYSFNWMDRYVLVILLENIKRDLALSDTSLGILSGFAFAGIYAIVGIPLARLADRGWRIPVIVAGLCTWSLMTAASGFARNYLQLLIARFGVAVGESACSPAAASLISDFFPEGRRATALAIYGVGVTSGTGLGLIIGGWANQAYGWRAAFLIVGLPGLILALLVRLTVREPRVRYLGVARAVGSSDNLATALRAIFSRGSFLAYAIALGVFSFSGAAFEIWTPVYFMRNLHMGSAATGNLSGFAEGVGGLIGTLGTAFLADRLGARDVRWYLWTPAMMAVVMVIAMIVFLQTTHGLMIVSYVVAILCANSYLAPVIAITQRIMPQSGRALATALLYLFLNLIGPGAGPLVAGVMNDVLSPRYGLNTVRISLTITSLAAAVGIMLMMGAARQLAADLRRPR